MTTPSSLARIGTAVIAAAALSFAAGGTATAAPPAPVPNLDTQRYLGTWLQLAAIPQPFNLLCARDTRAVYEPAPTGLTVRNSCTTWLGARDELTGTARVNDPETNAQLGVSFRGETAPATNYIVTALDPGYGWAVVVNPERTAGFVLSRTPDPDAAQWAAIRSGLDAAGVDSCLLLTSPVTGGFEGIEPLCAR
ncbi:lipocalin family protein [Nocardia yamanashiensis]|uniref:lipocalin family protein n=1 Tax=Nocardia yamanashiensis TaxID=209247 RepID=UPI001E4B0A9A|nr:lipocalin family protein [Nocardia yamanashiensis]UGT44892.1 lipocalin family protein [Nocardia yamanashiensis]